MKVFTILGKTLREAWRDRQLFGLYLAFPPMMILIYFLAFGQASGMANYLTILVDNRDQGALGGQLVEMLYAATFDGQAVFTVVEGSDRPTAEIALAEGKAAALLTIPANFSQAVAAGETPAALELLGDPLTDTYVFVRSFMSEITAQFTDLQLGWNKPLPVSYEFLPNTGKMSDFQYGVPGLLVFGGTFGVITVALMLMRELSAGTLQRLRLSRARAWHLLGGVALANLLMALLQSVLAYGIALAFGFKSPGSLVLGLLFVLILSLGITGCGFIAASYSRSEGAATGIGTAMMVPLAFLSGAVFPMPVANLFSIGSQPVSAYDIFPTTHAARGLQRVLLYGDGLPAISYELLLLSVLSFLLLALGAWLYQKKVLGNR